MQTLCEHFKAEDQCIHCTLVKTSQEVRIEVNLLRGENEALRDALAAQVDRDAARRVADVYFRMKKAEETLGKLRDLATDTPKHWAGREEALTNAIVSATNYLIPKDEPKELN